MTSYLEAVEKKPLERGDYIKLILENDLFWGLGTWDTAASSHCHVLGFKLERPISVGDAEGN